MSDGDGDDDPWVPVSAGEPDVDSEDTSTGPVFRVEYPLDPFPPEGWEEMFNDVLGGGVIQGLIPNPFVRGDTVTHQNPMRQERLEAFDAAVKNRVRQTNENYEREVVQPRRVARQQREAEKKAKAAREEEAKKKLKGQ